ncbi:MAG: nicotinate-nucleotide adenylyltransferase [Pseudomonadales bacterium]
MAIYVSKVQRDVFDMYIFMGGTFDPVHCGHLAAAREVSALFGGTQVNLMPTRVPVHKSNPATTPEQRLAMLELAVANIAELALDLRELSAQRDCYTVDTLRELRAELGSECPIVMVIGMDSYLGLPSWRAADELLSLCHVLVLQRPGFVREEHVLPEADIADRAATLTRKEAGGLYFFSQPETDISSTAIRGGVPGQVPAAVAQYILEHQLYR